MREYAWVIVPVAFALLVGGWLWCASYYKQLHGVGVKWWAIPFTHGALLWARRLPTRWEKHDG